MKAAVKFLITLLFAAALASPSANAQSFTCLPAQLAGSGTKALLASNPKGDFVAYYCPGEEFPSMVVCLKSTCSLVGSKRAFATFLSNPTLGGLNKAMAPFTRNPLRDPELKTVWLPHADEIAALAK